MGDEDIGRLNVTMDDALGMCRIEGIRDLHADITDGFEPQRLAFDAVLQGYAIEELHRDERLVPGLANLVNGANVGVIQSRCSTSLAAETFQRFCVLGDIIRKEFQGNKATELHVFGLVNNTHAAAAEFFQDAVVGDGLADHFEGESYVVGADKSMMRSKLVDQQEVDWRKIAIALKIQLCSSKRDIACLRQRSGGSEIVPLDNISSLSALLLRSVGQFPLCTSFICRVPWLSMPYRVGSGAVSIKATPLKREDSMIPKYVSVFLVLVLGVALSTLARAQKQCLPCGPIGPNGGAVLGAIVGAAAGVIIVTGVVLYEVTKKRTITGCVISAPDGITLTDEKDKHLYALSGNTATIKVGDRIKVKGKKVKPKGDNKSWVWKAQGVTKDLGACQT